MHRFLPLAASRKLNGSGKCRAPTHDPAPREAMRVCAGSFLLFALRYENRSESPKPLGYCLAKPRKSSNLGIDTFTALAASESCSTACSRATSTGSVLSGAKNKGSNGSGSLPKARRKSSNRYCTTFIIEHRPHRSADVQVTRMGRLVTEVRVATLGLALWLTECTGFSRANISAEPIGPGGLKAQYR